MVVPKYTYFRAMKEVLPQDEDHRDQAYFIRILRTTAAADTKMSTSNGANLDIRGLSARLSAYHFKIQKEMLLKAFEIFA